MRATGTLWVSGQTACQACSSSRMTCECSKTSLWSFRAPGLAESDLNGGFPNERNGRPFHSARAWQIAFSSTTMLRRGSSADLRSDSAAWRTGQDPFSAPMGIISRCSAPGGNSVAVVCPS